MRINGNTSIADAVDMVTDTLGDGPFHVGIADDGAVIVEAAADGGQSRADLGLAFARAGLPAS